MDKDKVNQRLPRGPVRSPVPTIPYGVGIGIERIYNIPPLWPNVTVDLLAASHKSPAISDNC